VKPIERALELLLVSTVATCVLTPLVLAVRLVCFCGKTIPGLQRSKPFAHPLEELLLVPPQVAYAGGVFLLSFLITLLVQQRLLRRIEAERAARAT